MARANDAIEMRLVRSQTDLEDDNSKSGPETQSFNPEFTHQLFGQNENIFGYKDLKVKIYYTSGKLSRFVSLSYSEKIPPKDGMEADDVLGIIREKVPGAFTSNIDQFSKMLTEDCSFKPMGDKLTQHELKGENGVNRVYEVYRADAATPGFPKYHESMQTFLLWFIDGASYVDFDDDRWEFFVVFEKTGSITSNGDGPHLNGSGSGGSKYHFVGYTSVYRYYAYPEKTRPRISQVLILPPFQRQGLGSVMLNSIYDWYKRRLEVLDITVEDPSDNFVFLRDYVDCKNCLSLESFSRGSLLKGWSEIMAAEAQDKLKMSKKQTRRVYEILKLKSIDRSNDQMYRSYRLEVKNRLNAPFVKMNRKQQSVMNPTDTAVTSSKEHRMEELKNLYAEVEEEYLNTIAKLEKEDAL